MAIGQWADAALRALFNPLCAACHRPLGPGRTGPVCRLCWIGVRRVSPPWCDSCGEPQQSWHHSSNASRCPRCVANPPRFDLARSFGLYEGPLRKIVHALKYQGHRTLGGPLGTLMTSAGKDLVESADAVVPVPLHPWRQVQRGFNQADDLARSLGRPVWRPLRRRRLGKPQAKLTGEERWANVKDAYRLSRFPFAAFQSRPRHVVLIDDVMTTGATLDACSAVLRDAGVRWVAALTIARAAATASDAAGQRLPLPPERHSSEVHR